MTDFIKTPKKYLGQHFLKITTIQNRIIKTAELSCSDSVLEVGPGNGELTFKIAKLVKKIVAVEKDEYLAKKLEILKKEMNLKNLKVINEDILKIDPKKYKNFKIVANLPYYITGQFLKKFLSIMKKPAVLMLQKEVANRIIAVPPKINILSLAVQIYTIPKIIFSVPKGAFYPPPRVDSSIIKLTPVKRIKLDYEKFFKLIKIAFKSKRQTLANNLKRETKLEKTKIEKMLDKELINKLARPQELSLEAWIKLTKIFPLT